jgi:hypothetical protein
MWVSWVGSQLSTPKLTGTTTFLIYSSDVLAPISVGAWGNCQAGPPLNPALTMDLRNLLVTS